MIPAALTSLSFASYPSAGQRIAREYLPLLRRLPLVVCPSFLQQIEAFPTLFPIEQNLLQQQCSYLQGLPEQQLTNLVASLAAIILPAALRDQDWVRSPTPFLMELSAYLWSTGQINVFRDATNALFAAMPFQQDPTSRTVVIILGKGAVVDQARVLRKLRPHGVLLTALQHETAFTDIARQLAPGPADRAALSAWYVDGGVPHAELAKSWKVHGTVVSYVDLAPVRRRVLERMQANLDGGRSGAEGMRTRMAQISARDAGAEEITENPVLQRFYTELFTASSGPQVFSTSFVQWTGRELARRAQPQQLVLRYAPRQHSRNLNDMFAHEAPGEDSQGSLADAEMGAFYAWLEMKRITAPGKLTLIAWVEDQPLAIVLSANAPAGVVSSTPMTLAQAFANFA